MKMKCWKNIKLKKKHVNNENFTMVQVQTAEKRIFFRQISLDKNNRFLPFTDLHLCIVVKSITILEKPFRVISNESPG